jgi:four helix bundle protein
MSQIADELRERTFRYGLRTIRFCKTLPADWVARELGRQLLRAGMGVPGNYWSACRGRSDKEFIAKLGVAADEADESVLWLMAIIQGGVREDLEGKNLLTEGQELRAILAKSHKTARENRRRRCSKSPSHQVTKSPTTATTP